MQPQGMIMRESIEVKTQECPVCQTVLPVFDGFVTWCDRCGWNVNPQQPEKPRNVFESTYALLGQKQSRSLLEQFIQAEALRPAFSISKLLAYVLAAAIHGITLIFAIGGIGLLVSGWPNLLAIAGGLFCIAVASILRPRFLKVPDTIMSRKEFPTLYKLVDSLVNSLQTREVSGIVINEQFNASFRRVGWQRKGVLHLGLPLWSILDDQEKIALIAHELAHSVNDDATRGFFIGTAIRALAKWYALLRPKHIWAPGSGIQGLGEAPFRVIMLGLASLAWLGAYLLSLLLWRESQRAEYLADYLAASVSGTEAMLSLMEKLHFSPTFTVVLRRVTLGKDASCDFFAELRKRVAEVPKRELERIKRVEQLEKSRLDVMHPPTPYRIELLQSHYVAQPKVNFLPSDFEQLEVELLSLKGDLQKKLIDLYRASLFS
ncbi:M48 family metallopeptidase [Chloroflexota bacterium]